MKKILFVLMLIGLLHAGEDGAGITAPPSSGGASVSNPNTWAAAQTYSVPMIWQHSATPANPSAGFVQVYVKNDNNLYIKNSAGTETQVGGGASLTGSTTANNTALGSGAGTSISTATGNTVLGVNAGTSLATTANGNNVFVGRLAGDAITTATGNTAVGSNALGAIAGNDNVAIGRDALAVNTSGENVAIGARAGAGNGTDNKNVFIGYEAADGATVSNSVFIGHSAGSNWTTSGLSVVIGSMNGNTAVGGTDSVLIGYQAGNNMNAAGSTLIGSQAGTSVTTGTHNTIVGQGAGYNITGANGQQNTIVGAGAGGSPSGGLGAGQRNTLVGREAGGTSTANTMTDTVMIGYRAGFANTANENTFIGSNAGDANTSGTGQTFVGYNAGTAATGNNNTLFGHSAGAAITANSGNTLLGARAGDVLTDSNNVFVGNDAGGSSTTATQNTFIGAGSGSATTSGDNNIAIGYNTSPRTTTTANSIAIGVGGNAADNEFTVGGYNSAISTFKLGKGTYTDAITSIDIMPTPFESAVATNQAGGRLSLVGGGGTGTGVPGDVYVGYTQIQATGQNPSGLASGTADRYVVVGNMFTAPTSESTISANSALNAMVASQTGIVAMSGGTFRVGETIHIRAGGIITTSATPATFDIEVTFAGGTLDTGALTPPVNLTDAVWSMDLLLHIRTLGASGTMAASGTFTICTSSGFATPSVAPLNRTSVTVDTTVGSNVTPYIRYNASTAGNSLTTRVMQVNRSR